MEKQRIGYLDAIRGFIMLLVVYNHVLGNSFRIEPAFSFTNIFITFRMPLFFFISGFLMYKANRFRAGSEVSAFLKKKAVVQLVPTLIFTVVFCLVFRYSYSELWFEKAKCGYWFTITLFYFFAIYAIERTLPRRSPIISRWEGYHMANTDKWYYAYTLDGDTVTVVDACHAQNMHE